MLAQIGILAISLTAVGVNPPLTAPQLLDRWEAGVKQIASYDLVIETHDRSFLDRVNGTLVIKPDGPGVIVTTRRSHILKQGAEKYGEFDFGDAKTPNNLFYLSKKQLYTVMPRRHQASISKGYLYFSLDEYEDYDNLYCAVGSNDRILLSRSRPCRALPRENGLYGLQVDLPIDKNVDLNSLKWTVWLDPSKNFLPVKMSQWIVRNGESQLDREMELDLKEVVAAVWAPVKGTIRLYAKGLRSDPGVGPLIGKLMGVITVSVLEEQSRFNIPIDESVFVPKIPPGTSVVDRIRNVVYVEGQDNPDEYLAALARNAEASVDKIPKNQRTPPVIIVSQRSTLANRIMIGVASVSVLGVLAFVIHRVRLARKARP